MRFSESSRINICYGNDQQRIKSVHNENGVIQTNYFVSADYEEEVKNGVTRRLNYLRANGKVFAIFVQEIGKADQMYYIHTDHLGSYDMVTNSSATVDETYAFDVWGYRRKKANWASYETRASIMMKLSLKLLMAKRNAIYTNLLIPKTIIK